jgi:hypothetical protein
VTRRLSVLLLSCACAAALLAPAGCGGGKQKGGARGARGGVVRNVDPKPAESIQNVIDRVKGAVTATDCEAVKGLLHSTYGNISDGACQAVKAQIDGFQEAHGAAYKTGAAISYRTSTGRRRLIVLALDADSTYRIAFITDVPDDPIGTPKPAALDRAALAAVRALRDGNCDAFLRLVSRTDGLGVGPDEEVCRRVSDVPFRRELLGKARARPVPLGGNADVAFYKLRTRPDAYYTLIMVRETPRAGGPSRYVLVTALPAV